MIFEKSGDLALLDALLVAATSKSLTLRGEILDVGVEVLLDPHKHKGAKKAYRAPKKAYGKAYRVTRMVME